MSARKREFIEKVFDLLVAKAQVYDGLRSEFIYYHLDEETAAPIRHYEFRIQGLFGFGGKYRAIRNSVDFYSEDATPEREKLQVEICTELRELKARYPDVEF